MKKLYSSLTFYIDLEQAIYLSLNWHLFQYGITTLLNRDKDRCTISLSKKKATTLAYSDVFDSFTIQGVRLERDKQLYYVALTDAGRVLLPKAKYFSLTIMSAKEPLQAIKQHYGNFEELKKRSQKLVHSPMSLMNISHLLKNG